LNNGIFTIRRYVFRPLTHKTHHQVNKVNEVKKETMTPDKQHKWDFQLKFRRHAYGWRGSNLAIKRIKEAISEIKKIEKKDPALAAEGAVLFIGKLSPALAQVDSSSGYLGMAVDNAMEELAILIGKAPVEEKVRDQWLKKAWKAIEEDQIPYLEALMGFLGSMCSPAQYASKWADHFLSQIEQLRKENGDRLPYDAPIEACLSCLYAAKRHDEILGFFTWYRGKSWCCKKWHFQVLADSGKTDEACAVAEESMDGNWYDCYVAEACEKVLLEVGQVGKAFRDYALMANEKSTYLATFRALAKKYPSISHRDLLKELALSTPGEEGKWFSAAKSVGLYKEALELARQSPCNPGTLANAACDYIDKEPEFAAAVGELAVVYLINGHGYKPSREDVLEVYHAATTAADHAGCLEKTKNRIKNLAKTLSKNTTIYKTLSQVLVLD
jgi:hypothetical protein